MIMMLSNSDEAVCFFLLQEHRPNLVQTIGSYYTCGVVYIFISRIILAVFNVPFLLLTIFLSCYVFHVTSIN